MAIVAGPATPAAAAVVPVVSPSSIAALPLDAPDPERAAEHMLSEQSHVDEALRRIAALPAMERR